MNTINGALFDFNGTLFFDSPLHVTAWDAISMELGAGHVTRTDLDTKFSGLPNKEILKRMVGGSREPAFYDAYSRRKEAMYRKAALALPVVAFAGLHFGNLNTPADLVAAGCTPE